MRRIAITEWDAKTPDGKDVKENLTIVLEVLVQMKDPKELPKGFEQFKLFRKLSNAFEKAKTTKELVLEEPEYKFLKDTVIKDIPMQWAGNLNIFEAIDSFINAKEE